MTNGRKQTQDIRLLSAYLDQALADSARQKLEERLKVEPVLSEQLAHLRQMKQLLAQLPRLRAPRNFTLTPEMVTVRTKRPPLLPFVRLATILASVLLVVLFGAEFILSNTFLRAKVETEMATARLMEGSGAPEPLIIWGQPDVYGKGGGGDETMMLMDAPEDEAIAEPESPTEESLEAFSMQEEPGDGALILGVNPDQAGEIVGRSQPEGAVLEEAQGFGLSPLRWAQIVFAVIALGGGAIWWILRARQGKSDHFGPPAPRTRGK